MKLELPNMSSGNVVPREQKRSDPPSLPKTQYPPESPRQFKCPSTTGTLWSSREACQKKRRESKV
ncbi:hypothetical protein BDZ45DRAFT_35595 [Acephala macrosclerotiorum]|nr:hypothetical protein BDZ45DRAFT_35595 [Acephala macrosclerotiorum]